MPEITIVVPVYNVEKYLRQCINSLLDQTFTDFEIILVDDGSTDGSVDIERKYAVQDSRVKVIEKERSNAGDARNIGLDSASGRYIVFLDSDDYYDKALLAKEYFQIEKDKADICVCDGDCYNERKGENEGVDYFLIREYLPPRMPFCIEDCPNYIFQVVATGPWLRMYRTEFVRENGLNYQSVIRGNDVLFSNMAMALAKKITAVDEVLIHHRIGLKNNLQSGINDTPDIYFDIELGWKKELQKRALFEKCYISFGMYVLNNIASNFVRLNESGKLIIKRRVQNGVLTELGVIDFLKEKFLDYVINPGLYRNQRDSGWIDVALKLKTWEFPEKSKDFVRYLNIVEDTRGFGVDELFPFEFVSKGSKVILYGLGKIGRCYIKQIKLTHWCDVLGVSDRKKDNNVYGYPYYTIEKIKNEEQLDVVIIAIGSQKISSEIERELMLNGIAKSKIFTMGDRRSMRSD